MRKKRLGSSSSAEIPAEVGTGARLEEAGWGARGATRKRPSQARWSQGVTVLRIPGPPSPTRSGELEPSPATQAPTYGVQRSLNSLAMVSMPPARATAM